jgi:ABC-2 type transport system permease protein
MFAEFKHTLRRLRGQIIGWGLGLSLFSLMMAFFYNTVTEMEDLMAMIENYPEEMMAFFSSMMEINTPMGYLDTYYFSLMTLILGVFVISACANLLAQDEERGILDLVLAHPVSRTALYWGRFLGLAAATAVVLLAGWLGWAIPSGSVGLDLTWLELLQPFLSLFAQLVLFGALALLLSLVLPAARIAGMVSGGLLVANFLVQGLANMNQDLEPLIKFTPLHYYQGGRAVNGLEWGWLGGLMAIAIVFAGAGWVLFQRRDIRVGGERSWRLPRLAGLLRKS